MYTLKIRRNYLSALSYLHMPGKVWNIMIIGSSCNPSGALTNRGSADVCGAACGFKEACCCNRQQLKLQNVRQQPVKAADGFQEAPAAKRMWRQVWTRLSVLLGASGRHRIVTGAKSSSCQIIRPRIINSTPARF